MTSSDPNNVYDLSQKLGQKLEQTFGTKSVAILAHSMGGLVASSMMDNYFFADHSIGAGKVSLLVTLATPHHGTPAANVGYMEIAVPLTIVGPILHYFDNVNVGFILNLAWDDYDGREFWFPGPPIPLNEDYSKIIAYGATVTSVTSIPLSLPDAYLAPPYLILAGPGYGYANDGIVPLKSALFDGTSVRTRQVDGSCDHYQIYSGQNTVNGGTPIFDSIATDLESIIPISAPASSVISYVSPPTLTGLPLPQTQPIRIIGSGFTSSSTLVFNGSIPSDSSRLTFISANEIDYNIKTDVTQANWTVQVVNGNQTSNLGYFTVNAPPANPTGSLVVNLSPAGIGAQWQVNGTYYNSGDIANPLTPGQYTVSFKPVSGYTPPANQIVTINANAQTTASGTYSVIAPSTYTLTLNYDGVTGYTVNQPFGIGGGNTYNAGAVVQLTANAYFGYHFVSWGGDASGTANPTTITMNGNKTVSANFAAGDPNLGTVIVTIQPPEAAAAGVTWGFNDNDFRASGTSYSYYPETVWVELHNTNGWIGYGGWVTFTAGQTTNYTFACSSTTGTIIGSDPKTYYTLAGSPTNSGSLDGTGNAAFFSQLWGVAVDKTGNIFVADTGNQLIRKVAPHGVVTTIAGQTGVFGYADGQGTNAIFSNIQGIAVDSSNNLYVADMSTSVIRKITPGGTVSTFAGQAGSNGSVDATGGAARFYFPTGIAVDTNGNVYVADSVNETIRKITPSAVVTTLAGSPRNYGYADGTGGAARFHSPQGVAVDTSGNVYVADHANQVVRKVTQAGVVTTIAGYPESSGAADGTGTVARFNNLDGIAVDNAGNI